jgi:hypothetical protein
MLGRIQMLVLAPFVVGGVVLGLGLYFWARSDFLGRWGIHSPLLTGALTLIPCAAISIGLGGMILKAISPRIQAWTMPTENSD